MKCFLCDIALGEVDSNRSWRVQGDIGFHEDCLQIAREAVKKALQGWSGVD